MTHTPGPWKVTAGIVDNPRLMVEDDIGNPVCAMSLRGVYGDTVKMTANAHLISAAPDMLEALEWLSNEFDCRDDEYGMVGFTHDEFRKVNAAIRKARGEK